MAKYQEKEYFVPYFEFFDQENRKKMHIVSINIKTIITQYCEITMALVTIGDNVIVDEFNTYT